MGSSARRNKHRNGHHTEKGVTKRARKYAEKELKRIFMQNGGPCGFRVHPEFGWCQRSLQQSGWGLTERKAGQWRKQRDLRRLALEGARMTEWKHVPGRGLVSLKK